jgi:hypothetical protein
MRANGKQSNRHAVSKRFKTTCLASAVRGVFSNISGILNYPHHLLLIAVEIHDLHMDMKNRFVCTSPIYLAQNLLFFQFVSKQPSKINMILGTDASPNQGNSLSVIGKFSESWSFFSNPPKGNI